MAARNAIYRKAKQILGDSDDDLDKLFQVHMQKINTRGALPIVAQKVMLAQSKDVCLCSKHFQNELMIKYFYMLKILTCFRVKSHIIISFSLEAM